MEHLFHFFGGGCGEHMLWPMIAASGSGAVIWVRAKLKRTKEEDNGT